MILPVGSSILEKISLVRLLFRLKALVPIDSTLAGIVISDKSQFLNALFPILINPSGKVIDDNNPVMPVRNALIPILVKPTGKVTFAKLSQPLNKISGIE